MKDFFTHYAAAFQSIQGMLSLDAALLMAAYSDVAAEEGVRSDSLEIGVHHGLSAILVAALRGEGSCFVAIDLFEEFQGQNKSRSGLGDKSRFLSNMGLFFNDLRFLRIIAAPSSTVPSVELGRTYSFCHIDGGHSAEETHGDLKLCSEILLPGGILVIDDYFNPNFPGVSEGAVEFMLQKKDALCPLAIGFNKVVFQSPCRAHLNESFARRFPMFEHTTARLWGQPVFLFGSSLTGFVDLERSTPAKIAMKQDVRLSVELKPQMDVVNARAGDVVRVPVYVRNTSDVPLAFSATPIGLSYHLLSRTGEMLVHDNPRFHFSEPLHTGQATFIDLFVTCPDSAGEYQLQIDLVWEGICWFKQRGNHAPCVPLVLS